MTDEKSNAITYPAQPIPPQEPGSGKPRTAALIAGALIVILVLGATAFAVSFFSSSDSDEPVADPTQTTLPLDRETPLEATTTTTITSDRPLLGRDDGASIAPRTPRAVGTPTPALPQSEFQWQQVSLPGGEGTYITSLEWTGDRFLAIGNYNDGRSSNVTAWESTDGSTWTELTLSGDFTNSSVWQVRMSEHGGIAVGDQFLAFDAAAQGGAVSEEYFWENNQVLIWTTKDGANWNRWEVDLGLDDDQNYWVSSSGVGENGFVALINANPAYQPEPVVLDFGELTLTLNEFNYTFEVTDASGTVLAEGSQEDLYRYGDENGQAVWDAETGDLIVVIPYEKWEEAYSQAYNIGGPIGGGYDAQPAEIVIEHDGWRVTLNEETYEFTVENMDTGEVVTSGSMDYMYRGPNPEIYDANGNLVLQVTWSEWDRAMDQHWQLRDEPYAYQNRIYAAFSSDGIDWQVKELSSGNEEFHLDTILSDGDGFIAFGSSYDEYGGGPEIWKSPNGLDWTKAADVPGGMYLWNVKKGPDGRFLSLGDSAYGNAVWGSTDGISWGEVFGTRIPEDRSKAEWFNNVVSGELGTFVLGSRETYHDYEGGIEPLTLVSNGRTMTFDDFEWPPRLKVTDADGTVLVDLVLEEEDREQAITYDSATATTSIADANGQIVFTFTDDEFYRGQDARWGQTEPYEMPTPTMYYSTDLETWTEVTMADAMSGAYLSQLAVGTDTIVMAGQAHYDYEYYEGSELRDEPYEEPPVLLFVGRR